MLDKHLKAETRPKSLKENEVYFEDYRITVLSDRLFRIEKDAEKKFEDEATQTVWFRDMPKQNFSVENAVDSVTVVTPLISLSVNKDFKKSFVVIGGKKKPISNKDNLLGTCRTLDNTNGMDIVNYDLVDEISGQIKLEVGVCSKSGVAVIDDKDSLILTAEGKIVERRKEEIDSYVFAYGSDYKGAVKALYDICGYAPMIPRYALGNWWSRYYNYTSKSYLELLDKFKRHNVPLTVATIDMDWHYSDDIAKELDIPEEYLKDADIMGFDKNSESSGWNIGWTGYTWNRNLFPDYKVFLKEIKKRNLKITLNLHPAKGIRYFEDQYEDFCKAMGLDSSTKKAIEFDFTDDNFINNYFKLLHKPYEKDGVAFWWIDWQQGFKTKLAGLDPLWALNHYHTLDNAENHTYPLILSRYSGVGSHRYPLGFTGDTNATWETLESLPYFTTTASNIGYGWWSHDIGGHQGGYYDGELFLRFCQYGVFNPIMRLHSAKHPILSKEPWFYKNGVCELVEEFMRLRHRLVPMLYTANYNCHTKGVQLIEPTYYYYPNDIEAYSDKFKNEYIFAEQLLVMPITKHSENGYSDFEVWFPDGEWTDIFTGNEYHGGVVKMSRRLDTYPVFAKSGAVIPKSLDEISNSVNNPKYLEFEIYRGNNEYKLYEDEGDKECFTRLSLVNENNRQKVILNCEGDLSVIPNRKIKLSFKNIYSGNITVYKNGKEIKAEVSDTDNMSVVIDKFDETSTYTIELSYNPMSFNEKLVKFATVAFATEDDDIRTKRMEYYKLVKCETEEEVKEFISKSTISVRLKEKLKEVIFN